MSMKLKLIDHLLDRSNELVKQQDEDEAFAILGRLACFRDLPAESAEMAQASLAEILIRRKKYARARRHLTAALLYRPDCARYHHLMGLALANGRKADPDRAREHFGKALELDAELTDCLADFGLFCLQQGDADEGIEALRKAVDLAPNNPDLLHRLVEALEVIGQREEARSLLMQARFRQRKDLRFEQLWNNFRYQETLETQVRRAARRQARMKPAELVLLPFVRPRKGRPASRTRRDGPSTLPPPHAPLRVERRSDMKHG